ncbi:hypothetical protein EX895_002661 [Sporisorium graminicola]|uniref:Uncharacterized protein n=1 Tax=Sporisorium graminicola TaxID=280036 RepID=A0A4V6EVN6_9BASI|nr:hypothetical protein EX895_002661 [Sporisorium graminicola]TKY88309.1 hypothetical protein EX895_002661 [Sporisorium graminicola]
MARQRGSRGGASSSTASNGRTGGRRGGGNDSSAPFSSAAYSSGGKSRRTPRSSGSSNNAAPTGLHDVYDFAQASTSATSKPGRGTRRALAGMQADDYADLPSKAKGKQRRRRADEDGDDDDEDEDSDDSNAAPIGPKVFDSEDELNASIEGSDEELDSDEAFGDSDEEKFQGWTFGKGAKSSKRKAADSDVDDSDEDDADDGQDDGMMDLSRMLDAASESSDDDNDNDEEDQDDKESDDDNDQSSSKLAKHIESFAAAGSKRNASTSDSEAGSDAEPSSKRSRRVLSERTEAIPETEFAAAHSGSTLRLEDFMNPLSSNIDFADVRKNTKLLANSKSSASHDNVPAASKKGGGALSAPLPSVVQDRLDRQGAYSITRDEVQGWQPTINRLRDAEHLSFPLQKPAVTKASTSGLVATFTPDNDMEASIAAMLAQGGLTEKQLAQQEDLAMNKLDPEEARARRDELRRMRMLMFRAEQKAKRVSKIKSKAYRKIHRKEKERLKEQMKELGSDMEDMDSEGEMEERLKAERDRARERATLKHKNTSKWAKNILHARHGEHNQEARNELDAQLRRGAELRSKIQGRELGDDSDSDDYSDASAAAEGEDHPERVAGDAFDELSALEAKEDAKRRKDEQEFERVGGKKGVYNMKFMKDARERQYAKIQGEVDDFVTEMQGLGAEADGGDSDDEDVGEAVIARKGSQAENGGSSVYVQGNKGRAMYGTTAATSSAPVAVQNKKAASAQGEDTSKPSKPSSGPVNGASSGGLEVGGDATITKSTPRSKSQSNPTKPTLPRSHGADAGSENDDDDDAANPWLTIDSTGQASKLSRKKNDSSLSANSTSAVAASKSALRASKSASKSASAVTARRNDEAISIDLSSRLRNRSDGEEGSDDEEEEEQPMSVVPAVSKKKRAAAAAGVAGGRVTALQQRELVADAFAADDVVSEFVAEKQATVDADASKTVDTRLPGWGSWGGRGIRTRPATHPHHLRTIAGIDAARRKDAHMAHVIISERRDKKQDKYRARDLPYPYTSVAQYEAALKQPLGKEWNTRIETQRLNLPRVSKKPGKLIAPVQRKF